MALRWWLSEVFKVLTPGTSRIRLNPLLVLAAACAGSVAMLLAPPAALVTALAALSASTAAVRGLREVLSAYVLLAPFIAAYSIAALIMQLVLGTLDPYMIVMNSGRILSIALLAALLMSMLSIADLISLVGRYSPGAALGIALAIKSLQVVALTLSRLYDVYSVNLGNAGGGLKRRITLTTSLARAVTYLSVVNALEVSEALYTRYSVLAERLRSWR